MNITLHIGQRGAVGAIGGPTPTALTIDQDPEAWTPPVMFRSSNVVSARYRRASSTLEVAFQNGGVYWYEGAPPEVWEGLKNSPSAGKFVSQQIKKRYRAVRVS